MACSLTLGSKFSENGCLFTCGDGSFGQLGHGDYNSHCLPEKVSYMNSRHVWQVACGMRHSLAIVNGNDHYLFHIDYIFLSFVLDC